MRITFDRAKRDRTLAERGLAFEDAEAAFRSPCLIFQDMRSNYGEPRFVTIGYVGGRMVMVIWTPRPDAIHVISMRKANEREQKRYGPHLKD